MYKLNSIKIHSYLKNKLEEYNGVNEKYKIIEIEYIVKNDSIKIKRNMDDKNNIEIPKNLFVFFFKLHNFLKKEIYNTTVRRIKYNVSRNVLFIHGK